MPFYGEPSKSCLECRVKRRRCDLKRPSCSQCIRANVECQGYRSKLEVTFKDQTRQVIRRARQLPYDHDFKDEEPSIIQDSLLVRASIDSRKRRDAAATSLRVWPSETFFLDNIATSYMFSRCMIVEGAPSTMQITFLEDMYYASGEGDMLREAIEAMGLLLSSQLAHHSNGVERAHAKYGRALRLTSAALNDATRAKSDKAIATVLMLQMYETANCSDMPSWETAARHGDGAARLLSLRGPELLRNHSGKKLFYLIRTQCLLASYFRRAPVPPSMLAMMRASRDEEWQESEESLNMLSDLSAICCKIRADIASGFLTKSHALELLLRLETDIRRWYAGFHHKFPVHKRPLLPGMDAYGAWFNDHPQRIEAMMWLQYHSIRLMVHSTVLEVLPQLTPPSPNSSTTDEDDEYIGSSIWGRLEPCLDDTEKMRRYSIKAGLDSRLEICATIPNVMQVGNLASGREAMEEISLPGALSTCWHLYTAAGGEHVPCALREWAVRMLNIMDSKTGVRLAGTLARQLEAEAAELRTVRF